MILSSLVSEIPLSIQHERSRYKKSNDAGLDFAIDSLGNFYAWSGIV